MHSFFPLKENWKDYMKIESMRNQAKKEIYFCVSIFRFKKKKKKKT